MAAMSTRTQTGTPAPARRRYDDTLRRQRAGETRDRIVGAGSDLLRGSSIRDWRALTVRAVAERAGVNERTVYRHFGNERGLRDAVMQHLQEEAGVDLAALQLEDIEAVTARILEHVSAYPIEPRPLLDATLTQTAERRRMALLRAVATRADAWTQADRTAAAVFDVLWSVGSYERLVAHWRLDRDEAIGALTWVIRLVEQAIRNGQRPARAGRVRALSLIHI